MHDNIDTDEPAPDGTRGRYAAGGEATMANGGTATPAAAAPDLLLDGVGRHLIDLAYDVRRVRADMPVIRHAR